MTTSRHSTHQHLLPLTSSVEDSRASLFPLPGSERARKMTVSSGLRCLKLSKQSGPLGYLEKMCLGSSQWASTVCFLTWRTLDTEFGRLLFQLVPLMPSISAEDFGLWRTPTVSCLNADRAKDPEYGMRKMGKGQTVTLADQVKDMRLWPTPQANKTTRSGELVDAMGQAWTGIGKPHSKSTGKPVTTALADMVKARTDTETSDFGHLNPAWVEWLMGFPAGWTDLDHSETP